jgi:hypothetical protein
MGVLDIIVRLLDQFEIIALPVGMLWITFLLSPVCTSVAFTSILYVLIPRITSIRCRHDKTHSNPPILYSEMFGLTRNSSCPRSFKCSKTRGLFGYITSNTCAWVWMFIFCFSVGILYYWKKVISRWISFLDDRNWTFPEVWTTQLNRLLFKPC